MDVNELKIGDKVLLRKDYGKVGINRYDNNSIYGIVIKLELPIKAAYVDWIGVGGQKIISSSRGYHTVDLEFYKQDPMDQIDNDITDENVAKVWNTALESVVDNLTEQYRNDNILLEIQFEKFVKFIDSLKKEVKQIEVVEEVKPAIPEKRAYTKPKVKAAKTTTSPLVDDNLDF